MNTFFFSFWSSPNFGQEDRTDVGWNNFHSDLCSSQIFWSSCPPPFSKSCVLCCLYHLIAISEIFSFFFYQWIDWVYAISDQTDKAFAAEAVDPSLIPGRIKPKSVKIGIHSFLAWRSAWKGPVVCGGQVSRWEFDSKTEWSLRCLLA